ncbi:MAG: AAA family ATPase, partial [Verrucomicrobiota bacterium]
MANGPSVIVVANQKGGVGKTTTVVNLASSYAHLGKKVLVIDLDYQANATSALGVDESKIAEGASITRAISEELTLDKVRLPSRVKNVDVLSSTRGLLGLPEKFLGQPNQFSLVTSVLDCPEYEEYDIILIDTHPSLDCLSQSAFRASHYYLIPLFAEADSARGLGHQIQAVEKIRQYQNPMLMLLGCVITRFDKQNATHRKFELSL